MATRWIACAAVLLLTGCGAKLKGTYSGRDTGFFDSLTFKGGGKVEVTFARMTKEGAYEIDGNHVKITVGTDNQVLTIDANGCLDGGGFIGKYCKEAEAGSGDLAGLYTAGSSTDGLHIDFRRGGKLILSVMDGGVTRESREGTYELSGNRVTIHVTGGRSATLTRNGAALDGDFGGNRVRLTRQ